MDALKKLAGLGFGGKKFRNLLMLDFNMGVGGGGCFACPANFSSFCDFFFSLTQSKGGPAPLPWSCYQVGMAHHITSKWEG